MLLVEGTDVTPAGRSELGAKTMNGCVGSATPRTGAPRALIERRGIGTRRDRGIHRSGTAVRRNGRSRLSPCRRVPQPAHTDEHGKCVTAGSCHRPGPLQFIAGNVSHSSGPPRPSATSPSATSPSAASPKANVSVRFVAIMHAVTRVSVLIVKRLGQNRFGRRKNSGCTGRSVRNGEATRWSGGNAQDLTE
jgi:hypothetical protein